MQSYRVFRIIFEDLDASIGTYRLLNASRSSKMTSKSTVIFHKSNPKLRLLILLISLFGLTKSWADEKKTQAPSHFMVGGGFFDVDRDRPRAMLQLEYRWEVNWYHLRPLVAYFITTRQNMFLCGGIGFDIFIGKKIVFTPSFAPGLYYSGYGKNLGFPLNFRSALELSYVFHNKGRFGVQFNHISNAHMLWRNPGANSLFIFYAIPFPPKTKR